MAKKGQRLYFCEECNERRYVHWVELNRAGRLKCLGCGSIRMNPCTIEAKHEREIGQLNLKEHEEGRGDVIRARNYPKKFIIT